MFCIILAVCPRKAAATNSFFQAISSIRRHVIFLRTLAPLSIGFTKIKSAMSKPKKYCGGGFHVGKGDEDLN